jgi:hypothetical protein
MESVKITINFGNAACQTLKDAAAILRELARRIDAGQEPTKVMDANGNSVGSVDYE